MGVNQESLRLLTSRLLARLRKACEKPPARQSATGDDSKPNWTAFWMAVRPLNLSKEFINTEASAFFNCSINKSLTEIPDLDNATLTQFAEYLCETQKKGA